MPDIFNSTLLGAGEAYKLALPKIQSFHSIQVGSDIASALTVDFEGSLDGVTWFQLIQKIFSAGEITAKAAIMFNSVPQPVEYIRLNVIVNTGGGDVTAKYLSGSTLAAAVAAGSGFSSGFSSGFH